MAPEVRSRKDDANYSEIVNQCKELIKKHNIHIVIPESHITGEHFL